jgi:beta-lactam-binding protein with PASTA domain
MSPAAGTSVATNSNVTLDVAIGSTAVPIIVPNVTGDSLTVAETTLYNVGLGFSLAYITTPTTTTVVGTSSSTSSTAPGASTSTTTSTLLPGVTNPKPNTVLQQSPLAGTSVKKGSMVTLTVLAPTSTYPVPSLQGQGVGQAAAALGQVGLNVATPNGSTCSNSVPVGDVVKTSPDAGSNVASGSTITLIVSTGVCQVVVPNVATLNTTKAIAVLQNRGLVPVVTAASPASCTAGTIGTVGSQSLAPGSFALYNSQIIISVCESVDTTTTSTTTSTTTTSTTSTTTTVPTTSTTTSTTTTTTPSTTTSTFAG